MPHKDPEENRKYRRKYDLERYHHRRKEAIDFLGGKCNSCGSTESLEIDHIDPNKKEIPLGKMWGISKERFYKELEKCQVLCQPCHKEKNKTDNGEAQHGTDSGYHNLKCRCDACKKAHADYMKEYYRRRRLAV